MKVIFQAKNKYIIRFDQGEEVIEKLKDFCRVQKIEGGFFFGLGAAREVTLSWYDLDKKEYKDKILKEKLEIISLFGNIAMMEKELNSERKGGNKVLRKAQDIIVHVHGSFSNIKMQVQAGHIKKLLVSATCEIFLETFEGEIKRKYSSEVGLNLME